MRHSVPISIRDEVHTKCPVLGSDNHVAPCTGAVEDVTKVWRQMFQESPAPSWSAGVLYYSEPRRSAGWFAGGVRSAGSSGPGPAVARFRSLVRSRDSHAAPG